MADDSFGKRQATIATLTDQLAAFLNDVGIAHYFAFAGLDKQRADVEEMIRMSAEAGNDDPDVFAGIGSPASAQWAPYLTGSLKTILADLAPRGKVSDLLGQMWIVVVFTAWESHYRAAIAAAAGVATDELSWPAMGDLRRMRHDVVHHRGVATERGTGRCELLKWGTPGEVISVGPPHVARFSQLTAERIRRWTRGDFAA
jgi:hypothetical protein